MTSATPRQTGKRMTLHLASLFAACVIGLSVLLSGCSGPAVTHSVEGRTDCLSCHGQNGVKPYPKWHAERALGNDACATCHKPTAEGRR
jgi:hypothetical protein